jgi:transcriptional regulator with XRE-family HTH domain
MRAQDVIRIARDRAGLTQQQLAVRSGRPRETIVRWEAGTQVPTLESVSALVAACDLDLVLRLAKGDTTLSERVAEQLELSPPGRLEKLLPADAAAEARAALAWLGGAQTPAVVIGQVGAAVLGAPQRPEGPGVEVVASDRSEIERELREAGYTPVDAPERWRDTDPREPWAMPGGGTVAIARDVPGTDGFRDLRRAARPVTLAGGTELLVAHPRDLLRIADASPRESERARVPGLQALLEATPA